ncbi:MAG: hypothetical protein HND56_05125 [Pseudomonadota bacterium]|nr:hypothetical protein [Pseudomonadota bacterium]QKK05106.1 MAG: hypothetical protein HND56_05125 [Pseudomonadota bacterium]
MESDGKNLPPFSIRLSKEERQQLRTRAGRMPVSAYIRFMLFELPTPRRHAANISENKELIERLLHRLGNTRISSNLNQLAKASNSGALPLDEETHALLHEACNAVLDIREELSLALGRKAKGNSGEEQ